MTDVRRRPLKPLLTSWAAALVFAGGLYLFQRGNPAFDDMIVPVYIVVAIILCWSTIKWYRRSYNLPSDNS